MKKRDYQVSICTVGTIFVKIDKIGQVLLENRALS